MLLLSISLLSLITSFYPHHYILLVGGYHFYIPVCAAAHTTSQVSTNISCERTMIIYLSIYLFICYNNAVSPIFDVIIFEKTNWRKLLDFHIQSDFFVFRFFTAQYFLSSEFSYRNFSINFFVIFSVLVLLSIIYLILTRNGEYS